MDAARGIDQRARIRQCKLASTGLTCSIRRGHTVHHIFEKSDRLTGNTKLLRIEGHGQECAQLHVNKVTGGRVPDVGAPLKKLALLLALEEMDHDASAV